MRVTTFEGFVENGQIRLSGSVRLPLLFDGPHLSWDEQRFSGE